MTQRRPPQLRKQEKWFRRKEIQSTASASGTVLIVERLVLNNNHNPFITMPKVRTLLTIVLGNDS